MKIRSKILGIYAFALFAVLAFVTVITYPVILNSQGEASVKLFIGILAVVGLISTLISGLLLEIVVVARIGELTKQVDHIRNYRDFYHQLVFKGHDEVATLAAALNQMLTRIVGSTNEVSQLNTMLQQEKADIEKQVKERTQQLSAEKARLKASVTKLSLGFIMTDTDNKITLINDQAKIILTPGSTEAEAAQSSGDQIMTVHDVDERFGSDFQLEDLLTQSLRDKKPVDTNDVIFGERVMRIIISPILDDASQPLGCVVLLEDITEQKLLERSKDEFLSIASHELRTPLTAIRGNTAMIQQFYQSSVNDTNFSEMLEDIHDSSVRLIAIVNDFLDASRLEQGKMQFKPTEFDVSEVLENVAYEIAPIAKEKHNQVLVDKTLKSLPPVYADKDHVKQIVYNLIGNAMKFTENGKITLSVTTGDKRFLKVTVTDTGLGIPKDKQRLLFRKFQQAGPQIYTRETSRGTGLGLYISKLLVESMNGVIALESSEPGKGSTFSFTLPLAKS